MASMAYTGRSHSVRDVIAALIAQDGTAGHPYATTLARSTSNGSDRDLADAAHFICLLHGRYPGVIDHASDRIAHPAAREWTFAAASGFAAERAFLTRLVVAAGPLPSTPGQAQSEAVVAGQTHALTILSQSDRRGTALGAAIALMLDWRTIRGVLDNAATRFGIEPPPLDLPRPGESLTVSQATADTPAVQRAIGFGAQQLLVQHRGLWDLLETRSMARRDA